MNQAIITDVRKFGNFLQISGRNISETFSEFNKCILLYVTNAKSKPLESHSKIDPEQIYLVPNKETNDISRFKVIKQKDNGHILGKLIDYGYDIDVPIENLILVDEDMRQSTVVISMPPMGKRMILSKFICQGELNELHRIKEIVLNATVSYEENQNISNVTLADITFDGLNFTERLIALKLGSKISIDDQISQLKQAIATKSSNNGSSGSSQGTSSNGLWKRNPIRNLVPTRPLQPNINTKGFQLIQNHLTSTRGRRNSRSDDESAISVNSNISSGIPVFIANELTVGTLHRVSCPYIENGPNLFSIQLRKQEHILDRMMSDLSNIPLKQLTTKPTIGMACVARYSEDKLFYRAAIMTIQPNACRVTYIDYGNSDNILFEDIFEIPEQFLSFKPFAYQFTLYECKTIEPISEELELYFGDLMDNKDLEMKVMPHDRPGFIQYCELYIGENNLLNLLKKKRVESFNYPPVHALVDDDEVIIRCVETAKCFYVQRTASVTEYEAMMDELFAKSYTAQPMNELPNVGDCCAAIIAGDESEWYRVHVLEKINDRQVRVQYVDFGLIGICRRNQLKPIEKEFLKLPRQAIECCLIDFENVPEVTESTGKQLEMHAGDANGDRKKFRVTVHGRTRNSAFVVNLHNELNVPGGLSGLVYRHSTPRKPFNHKSMKSGAEPVNSAYNTSNSLTEPNITHNTTKAMSMKSNASAQPSPKSNGNKPTYSPNDSVVSVESTGSDASERRQHKDREGDGSENRKKIIENNNNEQRRDKNYNKISNETNQDQNKRRNDQRKSDTNNKNSDKNVQNGLVDSGTNPSSSVHKEFIGFTGELPVQLIPIGSSSNVILFTWNTPHEFYIQLKSYESSFAEMNERIQKIYKNCSASTSKPSNGNIVIVMHESAKAFKRGKIVDFNSALGKYKVDLIDYGNRIICTQKHIYEFEKSLTALPALAIRCSLIDVIRNKSREQITNQLPKYISNGKPVRCMFFRIDGDYVFVKLKIGDNDVKDLMIADGLVSVVPQGLNLQLLSGQLIDLTPVNITDLTCFQAKIIGVDALLMCSHKDAKAMSKKSDLSNEFKEHKEKKLKVFVESVARDNILLLRIFLPFLDGANENRSKIPIVSDDEVIIVPHVESPQEIYIQKVNLLDHLTHFLSELYDFYSQSTDILHSPNVGDLCCAFSVNDENYYRAIVEDVTQTDKVRVRYIDYGNTEMVLRTNIKCLNSRHIDINEFAIKIYVPLWSNLQNDEIITEIVKVTNVDVELNLKIIEHYKTNWIVDLTTHGFSLIGNMIQRGIAAKKDVNEVKKIIDAQQTKSKSSKETETEELQQQKPQAINLIPGYITHADDPNRFFIQLLEDEKSVEQMQANLQIIAQSLPELHALRSGTKCICKYSADNNWYRAKVIDSDGSVTSVQFIDFGNTDTITDHSLIKSSNEQFDQIKPYAMLCSMPIGPRGKLDWDHDACKKLFNITEDLVQIEFISQGEQVNYVKLSVNERDITKELILEKFAEPLEMIRDGSKCYISHVNTLNDFFIQLDSDTMGLRLIEDFLADASKFGKLETIKPGMICIAPYENGYYRAKILNAIENDKTANVLFIDYGNTIITGDLRALPQNIASLPKLRKNCSLYRPEHIECWSKEAEDRFQELTEAQSLTVRLIKPGKKAIIEILLGDINVGEQVYELCPKRKLMQSISDDHDVLVVQKISNRKKCHVSHVNTPLDFYIQLDDDRNNIDVLEENLNKAYEKGELLPLNVDSIAIGQQCIAQFQNKDGYYRSKIIEKNQNQCRVLLIDYGTVITTQHIFNATDKQLLQTKPLALHCTLQTLQRKNFTEDALKNLQQIISGNVNYDITFQEIEIISDLNKDPIEVNFYLNSQDIVRLVGAETIADNFVNNLVSNAEAEATNLGAMVNDYVHELFDVDSQI